VNADSILDIQKVTKRYNGITAVDQVSITIPKGAVFGFLGPNGAGKTSLIRMIMQITVPDEGTLAMNGERLHPGHAAQVGYLPEERGLYRQAKVEEQLLYMARLRGLPNETAKQKIRFWGEKLGLTAWWNKKAGELSKGMQQLTQFAAAVAHDPILIILDEPFSGLDPVNTERIKDLISELNRQGATIIISTHRMEQVEALCDSIMLMNHGRIILQGNVREIQQRFRKNQFRIMYEGSLKGLPLDEFEILNDNQYEAILSPRTPMGSGDLLKRLTEYLNIRSFSEILPSLNEIFIDQVQRQTIL